MKSLKELVSNNNQVHFMHYRKGELWYQVVCADCLQKFNGGTPCPGTCCGFEFPVPISDTGDGEFLATDRAMMFMRYIRQHMNAIAQGRQECQ